MCGIPEPLRSDIRNTLLRCNQLQDSEHFKSIVKNASELSPWWSGLPDKNNLEARVDAVIAHFRESKADGQDGLVLLLRELANYHDSELEIHGKLKELAKRLEDIEKSPRSPLSDPLTAVIYDLKSTLHEGIESLNNIKKILNLDPPPTPNVLNQIHSKPDQFQKLVDKLQNSSYSPNQTRWIDEALTRARHLRDCLDQLFKEIESLKTSPDARIVSGFHLFTEKQKLHTQHLLCARQLSSEALRKAKQLNQYFDKLC